MTKNRITYVVFLGGTIMLGFFRDGYVSSILFFAAILLPLMSYLLALMTKSTFKISESIDNRIVVKGDAVVYTYKIYNSTRLLYCPMTLIFSDSSVLFKGSILEDEDEFILYPDEVKQSVKVVDCNYRGGYYIGIDRIIIRDFLNLFTLSYRNSEKQKIVVYPLIRELVESGRRKSIVEPTETIASIDRLNPSVFSGIRSYQEGDPIKQIHWKLTAKYGDLLTRQYEGSLNNKSKIIINSNALPFGFQESIVIEDYIIEGVVSVVNHLLTNNTPTSMQYFKFNDQYLTGSDSSDFGIFYLALAEMVFRKDRFKELLLKEFRQTEGQLELLIFTPFITKDLSDFIIKNKPSHSSIIIYIIDVEKTEVNQYVENVDKRCIFNLTEAGMTVYKISFEKGLCRLEVA